MGIVLLFGDEYEHSQLRLSQHEGFLEVAQLPLYLLNYFLLGGALFDFVLSHVLRHLRYLLVDLLGQLIAGLLAGVFLL